MFLYKAMDIGNKIRAAIKENDLEQVESLVKKYPEFLDNIDPKNGWTNLHYSSYYNSIEISKFLIDLMLKMTSESNEESFSGTKKQISNEDDIKLTFQRQSVIHMACLGNAVETLSLLLNHYQVCLDLRDDDGNAPTHVCCINGNYKCLEILFENHAYENLQNNDGNTPLHLALQYANVKCIEILINSNSNDELLNNDGWNALDLAFDDHIIQLYKKMKSNYSSSSSPSLSLNIQTPLNQSHSTFIKSTTIPITSAKDNNSLFIKTPTNQTSTINSLGTGGDLKSYMYLSSPNKINLPHIQSRKFSITSSKSDTNSDLDDNKLFSFLQRSSSNLSGGNSVNNTNNTNESRTNSITSQIIPPSRSSISINNQLSPRKLTKSQSELIESSKKLNSMSSRTFRNKNSISSHSNTSGNTQTSFNPPENNSNTNIFRSRTNSYNTHEQQNFQFLSNNNVEDNSFVDEKKRSLLSIPILSSRGNRSLK